jgi:hypothetical protein
VIEERADLERERNAARATSEHLEKQLADAEKAGGRVAELERELEAARADTEAARRSAAEAVTRANDLEKKADELASRKGADESRTRELESRLADAEKRANELEARATELEKTSNDHELRANDAEARVKELDMRASDAESRAKDVEERLAEAERRARELETRATDADSRATEADTRAGELESRAKSAEEKAAEAMKRAADAEKRVADAEAKESRAISRATVAEERVSAAENDAAIAENRAEQAVKAALDAKRRTRDVEASYAALELSIRRIREEIAGVFDRTVPTASSPVDVIEVTPEMVKSIPPSAPPRAPSSPPAGLDDEWGGGSAPPAPARASAHPPPLPSRPPAATSVKPPPIPAKAPSVTPGPPSVTPGPPSVRPGPASVRPAMMDSAPPPTRRPSSIPPIPFPDQEKRDALFTRLGNPSHAAEAARELRSHPEWLVGVPPPALLSALALVDYDAEGPVFDLGRAWERETVCMALVAHLRAEPDVKNREHVAWLLKHLAAPGSWKAIAELARSDDEVVPVRRWLLEALDRLAAGRAIGWREIGDVVNALASHPDAILRDGVIGILMALERSEEKRRVLLDILRRDDDEAVLASAVHALASVLPIELDPVVIERLLGHPSARVQRSVRDLVERAKREARH